MGTRHSILELMFSVLTSRSDLPASESRSDLPRCLSSLKNIKMTVTWTCLTVKLGMKPIYILNSISRLEILKVTTLQVNIENKMYFSLVDKERFTFIEDRVEQCSKTDISEVEQFLNCPQSPKAKTRATRKGTRVAVFREKSKAEMTKLELEVETLDQQISALSERIKMKHSNLAGHHRKPFHQKVCQFSRQSLKTELLWESSKLNTELTEAKRMRNQKMKGYIKKLKLLQENQIKYLRLLQEEEHELDSELSKFFV